MTEHSEQWDVAFPVLSDDRLTRLRGYGLAEDVAVGDLAISPGQVVNGLVVIEQGTIDILTAPSSDEPVELVVRHGPGAFVGELNLLTGQRTYVTGRVSAAGRIHRISTESFRRLMDEDPDLSDVLLRAFLARRALLQEGAAAQSIEIIGSSLSADALALRTYAARQRLPHRWLDSETTEGQAAMSAAHLEVADLPAVLLPGEVLRRTTSGEMGDRLGLAYHGSADRVVDLTVTVLGRPVLRQRCTGPPKASTPCSSTRSRRVCRPPPAPASRTTSDFRPASAVPISRGGPRCRR